MAERYLNPRLLIAQRNKLSPSPAPDDGTSSIYPDPQDDPLEKIYFYDTVASRKPVPIEPDHVQKYFSSIGRQSTPWRAPLPKDPRYTLHRVRVEKPLPSLPPQPPPRPSLWVKFNFIPVRIRYTIIISVLIVIFVGIILITLAGLGHFPPGRSHNNQNLGVTKANWNMTGVGQGTYYSPEAGVGACGMSNTSTQLVAALNSEDYGDYVNPNQAPCCGQCITVMGPNGSVDVTIVDKCPTCSRGDIDLSPVAFRQIANISTGRVPISWRKC